MTTSQFTEAAKLVLMQLLLGRKNKMHAIEGLLPFSPFAALSLGLGVVAFELPQLREYGYAILAAHPAIFIGQAALGFAVNLLTITTVKYTSSISFKLISMAKNAAIVLLSVPVFGNPISPTQALGYSVTVLGFGSCARRARRAPPAGTARRGPRVLTAPRLTDPRRGRQLREALRRVQAGRPPVRGGARGPPAWLSSPPHAVAARSGPCATVQICHL